jgi:hypothetical protein
MNVTPEIVKAEMDYRIERAHKSAELGLVRAGKARRRWVERLREYAGGQSGGGAAAPVNGASLAA